MVTDTICQFLPTSPIILTHTILDGIDRVFVDQFFQIIHLFVGSTFHAFFSFKLRVIVDSILIKLRRSAIHTDHHILARFITSRIDSGDN